MTSPAPRPDPAPGTDPDAGIDSIESDEVVFLGRMTLDEYFRYDEASPLRLEYVDGAVYAMSGTKSGHSRIVANITGTLYPSARRSGCRIDSQGLKLRTPRGDRYVPDVMVSCGPPPPRTAREIADPCLIVEVLSRSTERTDTGEKRAAYQEIPSVSAYLIVETAWRAVHRHWRDATGRWRYDLLAGNDPVPLPCPADGVLTLADIYYGIDDLPETPPAPRLRRVRETPVPAGVS